MIDPDEVRKRTNLDPVRWWTVEEAIEVIRTKLGCSEDEARSFLEQFQRERPENTIVVEVPS